MAVCLKFDGARSGNGGVAAYGYVLSNGEGELEASQFLGYNFTSNQAEYKALIAGLRKARALNFSSITIRGDSKLVVFQITGKYEVRNKTLIRYYNEVMNLLDCFNRWSIQHIRREENMQADSLARRGMTKGYRDYSYGRWRLIVSCWNARNAWRYLLNQRILGYLRMAFMLEVIKKKYPRVYDEVLQRCHALDHARDFDSPAAILAAY